MYSAKCNISESMTLYNRFELLISALSTETIKRLKFNYCHRIRAALVINNASSTLSLLFSKVNNAHKKMGIVKP